MIHKIPTLKGLLAFEAAYQFCSYTKAAKSLNVQQPAISYQIKQLEIDLGTQLFLRKNGQLIPTDDAIILFETTTKSFDSIRNVSHKIRNKKVQPTITIATYPGIATYWLTPHMAGLAEKLKTKPRVITLTKDSDLFQEEADCWILFGDGNWRGFEARKLISEEVFPVSSPVVAEKIMQRVDGGKNLETVIIEQEDTESRWLNWDDWFKQTSDSPKITGPRLTVNDHGLALHMAMAGGGVTLGWLGVIKDLLESKSLVRISDQSIKSDSGYWIVARPYFFKTTVGKAIYKSLIRP